MKWDDPILGGRVELRPVTEVLFRPEERHGASGIAHIQAPLCQGNGNISDQTLRIGLQNDSVSDFDVDRITAIQTRGVDLDHFSRKKPADRQRLEGSLRKPFLLALDRDSELRRKIVEGRKRRNEIRVRIQPSVDSR
jgi:hypothetical protein